MGSELILDFFRFLWTPECKRLVFRGLGAGQRIMYPTIGGGGGRGPHENNIIIFQTPFELHKPFILRGDLDKIISMM